MSIPILKKHPDWFWGYTNNPAVYDQYWGIAPNYPILGPNPPVKTGFTVAPALPAGLSMDPNTGIITGTPTAVSALTSYTVTAVPFAEQVVLKIQVQPPPTLKFTVVGSMNTARYGHSATPLLSGQILIAGGNGSSGVLASSEVYEPGVQQFMFPGGVPSPGNLVTARASHTATLLPPSGAVLIAGGVGAAGPNTGLASAEIYDPATYAFVATGNLVTARYAHTATWLPSIGQVLVAGGLGPTFAAGSLASAELSGQLLAAPPGVGTNFVGTGAMKAGRAFHTATLLQNGKVLVTGGYDFANFMPLASAEIYDPATGGFTTTGKLATARWIHTATLMPSGLVLIAGGMGQDATLASMELYDPNAGTFSASLNLATARLSHTATLLPNGNVLFAGGYNYLMGAFGASGTLATAEEYWPPSWINLPRGRWGGGLRIPVPAQVVSAGNMSTARYDHTATLAPAYDGFIQVLVAGGTTGVPSPGATPFASAELFPTQ